VPTLSGEHREPWYAAARRLLEGVDRLVFPPPAHCLVCGREGPFPAHICASCLMGWRRELEHSCPCCGRPSGPSGSHAPWGRASLAGPFSARAAGSSRPAGLCRECGSYPAPWDKVRPVGLYRGALRELICRFKYGGERWLGAPLGEIMAGVGLATLARPDFLVPVPLGAGRYRQRGFNQAEDLARVAGRRWRVPVVRALARRRPGRRQAGLDRASRWENLAGVFEPLLDLRGATITVVDDVMTTGATLANCAWALLQAGAGRVDGLVLATVPGEG